MSGLPSVSVVIPAYNVGDYIERTLISAIAQLVPFREIIVVDDGSVDQTRDAVLRIMHQNPNSRISLLCQPNSGVSAARNAGLGRVTGDYVIFLDGDDRVRADLCRELSASHVRAPEPADMYIWNYCDVDDVSGELLDHINPLDRSETPSRGLDVLKRAVVDNTDAINMVSVAFKVDLLRRYRMEFTPHCASAEDSEFIWKALCVAKSVTYLPKVMGEYVLRPGSASRTPAVERIDGAAAYVRVVHFLNKFPDETAKEIASVISDRVVPRWIGVLDLVVGTDPRKVRAALRLAENRNPGLESTVRRLIRRRRIEDSVPRLWCAVEVNPRVALTARAIMRAMRAYRTAAAANSSASPSDNCEAVGTAPKS